MKCTVYFFNNFDTFLALRIAYSYFEHWDLKYNYNKKLLSV
jgi:hypothetical protein